MAVRAKEERYVIRFDLTTHSIRVYFMNVEQCFWGIQIQACQSNKRALAHHIHSTHTHITVRFIRIVLDIDSFEVQRRKKEEEEKPVSHIQ